LEKERFLDQPEAFEAYFAHITQQYAPSTMWTIYSCLQTMRVQIYGRNFDDVPRIRKFLKKRSKNHKKKKAPNFTLSQMRTFALNAPTTLEDNFLQQKVVLFLGLYGACRADDMHNLCWEHVQLYQDPTNTHITVVVPPGKNSKQRSFTIPKQNHPMSPFQTLLKYASYFSVDARHPTTKFLRCFKNGKPIKRALSKRTIAAVVPKIAAFLGLENPSSYTGHSLRHTATTFAADAGVSEMNLLDFGGWTSTASMQGYIHSNASVKNSNAAVITKALAIEEESPIPMAVEEKEPQILKSRKRKAPPAVEKLRKHLKLTVNEAVENKENVNDENVKKVCVNHDGKNITINLSFNF